MLIWFETELRTKIKGEFLAIKAEGITRRV